MAGQFDFEAINQLGKKRRTKKGPKSKAELRAEAEQAEAEIKALQAHKDQLTRKQQQELNEWHLSPLNDFVWQSFGFDDFGEVDLW